MESCPDLDLNNLSQGTPSNIFRRHAVTQFPLIRYASSANAEFHLTRKATKK
jgi:hypothetical protein